MSRKIGLTEVMIESDIQFTSSENFVNKFTNEGYLMIERLS